MGWVVNVTPRPLYPQERPGTHCMGDWVSPRAGLDGCGKSTTTTTTTTNNNNNNTVIIITITVVVSRKMQIKHYGIQDKIQK
jgi:hypothetical protein